MSSSCFRVCVQHWVSQGDTIKAAALAMGVKPAVATSHAAIALLPELARAGIEQGRSGKETAMATIQAARALGLETRGRSAKAEADKAEIVRAVLPAVAEALAAGGVKGEEIAEETRRASVVIGGATPNVQRERAMKAALHAFARAAASDAWLLRPAKARCVS